MLSRFKKKAEKGQEVQMALPDSFSVPSCPPAYDVVPSHEPGKKEGNVGITPTYSNVWKVTGSIRVTTNYSPGDWKHMEYAALDILDSYNGNMYYRPINLSMYWLMLLHLKPLDGPIGRWRLGADFNEPIKFLHKIAVVKTPAWEWNQVIECNWRSLKTLITVNLRFNPSIREAELYETYIQETPMFFKGVSSLKDIFSKSKIKYTKVNGKMALELS